MANFSKQFQDEVRRLARKEAKTDLARLKADVVELRKALSATRKQLSTLQQGLKRVKKVVPAAAEAEAQAVDGRSGGRVSAKTIIKLRERLGLTQGEFAKLVGVTGQSIYQWEHKEGTLTFRRGAKERIIALKGIGSREARRRLEEMNVTRKRGPRNKK